MFVKSCSCKKKLQLAEFFRSFILVSLAGPKKVVRSRFFFHLSTEMASSIGLQLYSNFLYSISVLYLCTLSLYSISVLNLYTQSLYSISVLNLCTQPLYSISVLYLCTLYLCSPEHRDGGLNRTAAVLYFQLQSWPVPAGNFPAKWIINVPARQSRADNVIILRKNKQKSVELF